MRKCNLKYAIYGFILLMLSLGTHFAYNYFTDNVHVVLPHKIYRSAQLNAQELTAYQQQYHLKSIINLRGIWTDDGWYQVETQFAQQHHLTYVPLYLSAYKLPTHDQLMQLIHILETTPQPYMFHCKSGADRTGLASAISLILFDPNVTIAQLKNEMSWEYNVSSPRSVGFQVMQNYFYWLQQHHLVCNKTNFLHWANDNVPMKVFHGYFF